MTTKRVHIGFISTRLAGTDGVSLETEKWASVLNSLGHECFYFAGESDRPAERSMLVPEAHFTHPQILALTAELFEGHQRSPDSTGAIHRLRYHLKQKLYEFVLKYALDLLIIENALSLPMNLPLGLAISELIVETGMPTIAHHHDFFWERTRFSISSAGDYLNAAFPPILPSITHVVINSIAAQQLSLRTGADAMLVPNVMDFDHPPGEPDEATTDLRAAWGVGKGQHLLLQPTRIVPRKRIELAIELTRRLDLDAVLAISHASGDEGSEYMDYLRDYAELMDVELVFGADIVGHQRDDLSNDSQVYSLADAYQAADLVTYPSSIEGFGNAFLETIYYRRPLVINAYDVYKTDIRPKGFDVISFEDYIQEATVEAARECLLTPEVGQQMAEHNYEIGRRFYSFSVLEGRLVALLNQGLGT
jgi:mannosylglucosylglycerate synthase